MQVLAINKLFCRVALFHPSINPTRFAFCRNVQSGVMMTASVNSNIKASAKYWQQNWNCHPRPCIICIFSSSMFPQILTQPDQLQWDMRWAKWLENTSSICYWSSYRDFKTAMTMRLGSWPRNCCIIKTLGDNRPFFGVMNADFLKKKINISI